MRIRMHEWSPRQGYALNQYIVAGKLFRAGYEYEVDDRTGEYLLAVRARPGDPSSPLAFVEAGTKAEIPTPPPAPPVRDDEEPMPVAAAPTGSTEEANNPIAEVESQEAETPRPRFRRRARESG